MARVQALEDNEDLIGKLLLKPDPVILNGDAAKLTAARRTGDFAAVGDKGFTGNRDNGSVARLLKFEGVRQKVLKKLPHLKRIGVDER